MKQWYETYVLPALLDIACGQNFIGEYRNRIVPLAQGRVLEIGMGTGLNFAFYEPTRVKSIVGVEPSKQMHALALKRSKTAGLHVELMALSAETLPVPDCSFDSVVSTFTLCTIADPLRALKEIHRCLTPGGRFLFLEHGLAPQAKVQRWQRRIDPVWKHIAGGCHISRDMPALFRAAGFEPNYESTYLGHPKPFTYVYYGAAMRASLPTA
jgi:ubiquinone/menaquinone biosynthesis C-methylase UbiE